MINKPPSLLLVHSPVNLIVQDFYLCEIFWCRPVQLKVIFNRSYSKVLRCTGSEIKVSLSIVHFSFIIWASSFNSNIQSLSLRKIDRLVQQLRSFYPTWRLRILFNSITGHFFSLYKDFMISEWLWFFPHKNEWFFSFLVNFNFKNSQIGLRWQGPYSQLRLDFRGEIRVIRGVKYRNNIECVFLSCDDWNLLINIPERIFCSVRQFWKSHFSDEAALS